MTGQNHTSIISIIYCWFKKSIDSTEENASLLSGPRIYQQQAFLFVCLCTLPKPKRLPKILETDGEDDVSGLI